MRTLDREVYPKADVGMRGGLGLEKDEGVEAVTLLRAAKSAFNPAGFSLQPSFPVYKSCVDYYRSVHTTEGRLTSHNTTLLNFISHFEVQIYNRTTWIYEPRTNGTNPHEFLNINGTMTNLTAVRVSYICMLVLALRCTIQAVLLNIQNFFFLANALTPSVFL